MPLLPGAEEIKSGAQTIHPVIQIPSNLPRYAYESYESALIETGHPWEAYPLSGFRVFVVDKGFPLPHFVQGQPMTVPLPPSNPGPQPICLLTDTTYQNH
jgi:hypothetical protein